MSNITLSVDDDVVKKVKKIAVEKNTTLTAMVREFLNGVAARDLQERENTIHNLSRTFESYSRDMGEHHWTREELHERG